MKILISGYYGYGNTGDEAILTGLLTALKPLNDDIVVLSARPKATSALHAVKAKHRYKELLTAIFNCDALISGGGGLLQDKTSRRSLLYYLAVISLARLLGKKVILIGQSIGPLSPLGKKLVGFSLKGLAIAVRDKASQKLLAEMGVKAEVFADLALLMPHQNPIPTKKPQNILLIPRGGYPQIQERLMRVAVELSAQGYQFKGLAMQAEEDVPELEKLSRVAEIANHVAHSPQEALKLISQSDYVISARLHGLILAAKAHVPFQGLIYDPKVAAFLEESGGQSLAEPCDLSLIPDWNKVSKLQERAKEAITWLAQQLQKPKNPLK
ncbi:MAG: polysaccharide pyruvyl transferase CsaB [Deinococcales bacterium]